LAEPICAVWLDPTATLGSQEREQLAAAGWQVHAIRTLDDLPAAAADAQCVVVRLRFDTDTLTGVRQTLAKAGLDRQVVCRLDTGALELAVAVAQLGLRHVVRADEWGTARWRQLAQALNDAQASPAGQTGTAGQPETAQAAQQSATAETVPAAPSAQATARQPLEAVFVDPASQYLLALARRVAQTDVTALLIGPTGAGKEVLARVLHEASPRASGPFVACNCAAMPEHLIEDMLFGHERGAFTHAHRDHKGLFEQAQGGTLFLDEIGEMSPHLQTKLLRVLQERELTRLCGQTPIRLDVRVVAATNKDLRQAMLNHEFREDLYYRIATFKLRLLPLAERPGDIMPLVGHCLSKHGRPGVRWPVTVEARNMLMQYPWPGNVRELENVIKRATVLSVDGTIGAAQLMFDDWAYASSPLSGAAEFDVPHQLTPAFAPVQTSDASHAMVVETPARTDLQSAVKQNEHQMILAALAATRSKTEAAEKLGISPRTLRYKMARLRERGLSLALSE
ncbi:MAG: Nitrogen assimilation regulatory protein, partial [Pseudomonadota bacterium]